MANIIEQQDLLKGLPDARLSLLLQKPDASIPPFLVAAEAQRRQAIRQQFAGDGGKESVVDTLTKQLANVPQNIQAPSQMPPQMPPPQMQPQMAGIGALPQGQQQMANGGPVRRFAGDGYVEPMWKIPDYSSVIPRVGDWVGSTAKSVYDYATTPWGNTEAPANPAESSGIDLSLPDFKIPNSNPNFGDNGEPSPYTDLTPKPKKPPSSTAGTTDTSPENKYKSMEADMRKRLEGLYAADEPSNWENAQKWFAMSQQIMNPDATLMQGLVNAGASYADSAGNQAAQQRQGSRAQDEALLKWDMNSLESQRSTDAQAQQNQLEAMKYQSEGALKEAEYYRRAADDVREKINRRISALTSGGTMTVDEAANDPEVKKMAEQISEYNRLGGNSVIQSKGFRTMFGGRYNLPAGFEQSDGDSISSVGG